VDLTELPKKTELMEKFKLQEKRESKKNILVPRPTSIYKLSMTSMVWNSSTGQLGLAVWLCSLPAPAHLIR